MKATLTLETIKGLYAERTTDRVNSVAKAQTWAMEQLDKMPDTVDGTSFMDWTRCTLVVERDKRD